jgi:hypothetical protein
MRRIARVTEDLGRAHGGFYIEAPDIPEGITCQEWRRRRTEMREAERPARLRPTLSLPAIRPRVALPQRPRLRPGLAEVTA